MPLIPIARMCHRFTIGAPVRAMCRQSTAAAIMMGSAACDRGVISLSEQYRRTGGSNKSEADSGPVLWKRSASVLL